MRLRKITIPYLSWLHYTSLTTVNDRPPLDASDQFLVLKTHEPSMQHSQLPSELKVACTVEPFNTCTEGTDLAVCITQVSLLRVSCFFLMNFGLFGPAFLITRHQTTVTSSKCSDSWERYGECIHIVLLYSSRLSPLTLQRLCLCQFRSCLDQVNCP